MGHDAATQTRCGHADVTQTWHGALLNLGTADPHLSFTPHLSTSGSPWMATASPSFFPCDKCGKVCKSLRGLTQHSATVHRPPPQLKIPPRNLYQQQHPLLNGTDYFFYFITDYAQRPQGAPCDHTGRFLPPGTLPTLPPPKSNDDWTPFTSRAGFELAEILYRKAHLSQSAINQLLEIWTTTLLPHDDLPPITDHCDLHAQIDAIKLGDVPWKSYTAKYQWLCPTDGPIPAWMDTKYQLWYYDPRQVIHHLFENPEFASGIDYAPHRDFQNDCRQYRDFMSGDWAWDQCVG